MSASSTKEEHLIKGHNGLETCVILSEDYARMFAKREFVAVKVVKLRYLIPLQKDRTHLSGLAETGAMNFNDGWCRGGAKLKLLFRLAT